jgi:hypothetical protein
MKLIRENEDKSSFKPFRITLEITSEEEAHLLWHVFNHGDLRRMFMEYRGGYDLPGYKKGVAKNFEREGMKDARRYIETFIGKVE